MDMKKKYSKINRMKSETTGIDRKLMTLPLVLLLTLASSNVIAQEKETAHGSLSELGSKLSDPTSDVWALFTEFDLSWSRGNLSDDNYKLGGDMIFQPMMPFKITKDWKMLTRPTVPIAFGAPVPTGFNPNGTASFDHKSGLGDISCPLLFSPVKAAGQSVSLGFGPTLQFPTHTLDELGTKTWELGPSAVATYKTKKHIVGFLGQYWWSYADYGNDTKSASHGSLLPFYYYNLPNAWQIGSNATMTYNNRADSENQWNVPLGITLAKTTMVGKMPVKFQLGVEYSVEREDEFGKEWQRGTADSEYGKSFAER
jgi:hypothetical protein